MKTEIYWVHDFQPGRLAIMPLPCGGDRLEDELRYLKHLGVDVMASLLTQEDELGYALAHEEKLCGKVGIQYLSFPIEDHDVPDSLKKASAFVDELAERLADDKDVAIHCLAGIGRSGLIAACLLVGAGFSPGQACDTLTDARGFGSPETEAQREWVVKYAESLCGG